MSAQTMPLRSASHNLLAAARRGQPGAPTLHEYRVRGAAAAERLQDRPRPR